MTTGRKSAVKFKLWHAAYRRWYSHNQVGHRRRAAAWGWGTDTLCHLIWPELARTLWGRHR